MTWMIHSEKFRNDYSFFAAHYNFMWGFEQTILLQFIHMKTKPDKETGR